MKKRIVCVLLTLIMLLGLIPMGASAASHTISEAAITVLKQMTTYKDNCYHYAGSEFRTGYGTVCEGKHVFDTDGKPEALPAEYTDEDGKTAYKEAHEITEKNADTALRKALIELDAKVCAFETANGLSLKQNQHDALVVFSYDAGTGWMDGTGVLKSVIINKGTATELMNAMNLWSTGAANGNDTDLSRRKVEVNMYVNGIYSNIAPSSYYKVTYDANGGSMPQANYNGNGKYDYYFDGYNGMEHPVIPTKNGAQFLGWYMYDNESESWYWYTSLTTKCNGKTLVALWQEGFQESDAVEVYYQLHKSHLASKKVYDSIFSGNSNSDKNEDLADLLDDNDDLVWVERDMIDQNGTRWSRLAEIDGWVKVGETPVDNESTTDSHGTVIATATVTASGYLNVRKEAGTDNAIVGALAKNETVDIYEIKTVNGHQWGRCKSGWLCLTYTRLVMKDDVSVSDVGAKAYAFSGTYTGAEDLYVYSEPNADSNYAQYPVPHRSNPELDGGKTDLYIPGKTTRNSTSGISVTMTNFFSVNGEIWVKATWKNPEMQWKSSKITDGMEEVKVSRSGWVKFSDIQMSAAKFTVAATSVNVRKEAGDAAELTFTLNKGVQVQVTDLALVNENLWGYISVKLTNHVGAEEAKNGWVNLASKYFTRDGAPAIEENDNSNKKLVATVVGTDSLKVRKTGATYGQQIGSLSRGTTVAVWEDNGKGWYKVDSNKNGVYDYKEDGWCSEKYLDIHEETVSNTVTDSNGNTYETNGTGKGIVANTYSGVNVRTGPGTGYAANGKLLPGTVVEILETKNAGKWGRVSQGWICMDYVTMISYNEVIPETAPDGGAYVESFDKADKTTTTAVYTGVMKAGAEVLRNPTKNDAEKIRYADKDENVTIYELAKVTETVVSDTEQKDENTTVNTTVTVTSYWARINDGWIENPEDCLQLNALDEKVHTQTSVEKLNVRKGTATEANESGTVFDVLIKGDQVAVTALDIIDDKVWGRIDTNEGTGWIRLDYMSEGAIYVKEPVQNNTTTTPSTPVLGNGSSTGGFVDNSTGYRYTGKIIRANEVNVRANPSTSAAKTTALKSGAALVIYETTIAENMAWGRCDAGWVYLYYVDLTPVVNGAVDARVVYNDNTIIYSDVNCSSVAGTYSRMSTIDIYEIVGKMARTELGWVNVDNLL